MVLFGILWNVNTREINWKSIVVEEAIGWDLLSLRQLKTYILESHNLRTVEIGVNLYRPDERDGRLLLVVREWDDPFAPSAINTPLNIICIKIELHKLFLIESDVSSHTSVRLREVCFGKSQGVWPLLIMT